MSNPFDLMTPNYYKETFNSKGSLSVNSSNQSVNSSIKATDKNVVSTGEQGITQKEEVINYLLSLKESVNTSKAIFEGLQSGADVAGDMFNSKLLQLETAGNALKGIASNVGVMANGISVIGDSMACVSNINAFLFAIGNAKKLVAEGKNIEASKVLFDSSTNFLNSFCSLSSSIDSICDYLKSNSLTPSMKNFFSKIATPVKFVVDFNDGANTAKEGLEKMGKIKNDGTMLDETKKAVAMVTGGLTNTAIDFLATAAGAKVGMMAGFALLGPIGGAIGALIGGVWASMFANSHSDDVVLFAAEYSVDVIESAVNYINIEAEKNKERTKQIVENMNRKFISSPSYLGAF